MSDLRGLQRAFQRHVYRPGRAMRREVVSTARAGAARRLSVYVHAYGSRLVEALGNDYEALKAVLGESAFERAILEFVAAHPSRHPNLRWYGGELAAFLARSPRTRARPLLAELAAFEWALGLAFDAADSPVMTVEEVGRTPAHDWPAMRFGLHPSVRRLALRSNAPAVWRAARDGKRIPRATLRRAPAPWLVWRKGLTPFYRVLPKDEAWALAAVARGRDFAAICAGLRRFAGETRAAQRGAQLLKTWLRDGVVAKGDLVGRVGIEPTTPRV